MDIYFKIYWNCFSGEKITVSKSNQGSGELLVEGKKKMDFKVYGNVWVFYGGWGVWICFWKLFSCSGVKFDGSLWRYHRW